MSQMTRAAMVAAIVAGGSVMLAGKIVTKVDDLPGEEEMATTDEEKAAVAADLREQMEQLSVRLAKVEDQAPSQINPASGVDVEALQASVRDAIARAARAEGERDVLGTQVATLAEQRDSLMGQVKDLQHQVVDYSARNNSATTQVNPPAQAPLPPAPTTSASGTPLPADFPKRDQLVTAGLDTVEAVAAKTVEELSAVEGITVNAAKAVKQVAETALSTTTTSPF